MVRRNGITQTISAAEIMPGDTLLLSEGDHIVADARLLESSYVRVDESLLTGESVPVIKDALAPKRKNGDDALVNPHMLFAGSTISHGNAVAVVVAIGAHTRIGELSANLHPSRTPTPLEKNLRTFSRGALGVIALLMICLYALGVHNGLPPTEMAFISVALAVSVIPEGLPAVVTIVLAAGMRRLAQRKILVKKLSAVEALGQIQILAFDKTGTITSNKLLVSEIRTAQGAILENTIAPELLATHLSFVSRLPAHAHVRMSMSGACPLHGDPTEAALLAFAHKHNVAELHTAARAVPFEYETKISHAFFTPAENTPGIYSIVGAPEKIIHACTHLQYGSEIRELTSQEHGAIAADIQQMAERGLRVVAVARKNHSGETENDSPRDFIFEGLLGLSDTIRPEALHTIARIKGAGIKVIMITGDLPITARAMAKTVGIFEHGDHVITGAELQTLSEKELCALLPRTSVFARVSPTDKLRIIELYEKSGFTIAMTGDGVNDAPSLVAAHVGIAMAKSGTDVARHAADVLLLNDNLESLVAAIDEGRTMYQRLRTVLMYLTTTNFGEICMIAAALFLRIPVPLTAVQIIWLNLVTDGFLDVSLALEPKNETTQTPKHARSKFILHGHDIGGIICGGLLMAAGSLFMFMYHTELSLAERRTAALIVMSMFQWIHAWVLRTERSSMFSVSIMRNPYLIGATGIVLGLQLAALYIPFLNRMLGTAPLAASLWGEGFLIACSLILFEETRKFVRRQK
jgi:Ca2+-transporting ATPase